MMSIGNEEYELVYQPHDPFIADGLEVAYCDGLAEDFRPIIFDPRGCGVAPFPPELMAYRLIVDPAARKICILYEVYWGRQDCTWRELNKDHDHDYEQIHVHVDTTSGKAERVVVSSVGPMGCGGHGVEIYAGTEKSRVEEIKYTTSPMRMFPWGGASGRKNLTQMRVIPIERLYFEDRRPAVVVLNCYHVFTGLKRRNKPEGWPELSPRLVRLDRELLDTWYYHNSGNRFGHDISKPLDEPCILYYPPPGDLKARVIYRLLSFYFSIKRTLNRRKD